MKQKKLINKNVIISAAADGIGWIITKTCLSEGAKVYLCDNNKKSLKKVYSHPLFNKKLFASLVDVSDEKEVMSFFKEIKKQFIKIDVLVNNVGIAGPTGEIEKLNSKEWEKTIQVNLNSHFYFLKQAIPLIKKSKRGSIINLSSTAGIFGFPLRSAYAASKWAIIGLTKTLAMELGNFNIRVNAICPGSVSGERMERVIAAKAKSIKQSKIKVKSDLESMTSIRGFVTKEDISNMSLFLMIEDSKHISGQIFPVDGHTERMS